VANLQLAVKGEYFDAMIRGEKTEEYRLCNDYWNKRLVNRKYDRLIITKGYPKRDWIRQPGCRVLVDSRLYPVCRRCMNALPARPMLAA
jgi:hypothetical protein